MSHGRCIRPSVILQESSSLLKARGIVVPVEARGKYARDQMLQGQAAGVGVGLPLPSLERH